jgi:hypothetical protein
MLRTFLTAALGPVVRLWRSLWHQTVVYGDPELPVDVLVLSARDFPDIPPFDPVRLILTEEGGFRLLLCNWLVNVDPDHGEEVFYQPLIWVEYVPPGDGYGRHAFVTLTLPPARGQLTFVLPLSLVTLRTMGPCALRYESWSRARG